MGLPQLREPRRAPCQPPPPIAPFRTWPGAPAISMVPEPNSRSFGCVARFTSLSQLRYVHRPTKTLASLMIVPPFLSVGWHTIQPLATIGDMLRPLEHAGT